ncbi:hypothetical protein B0T13DRAFT_480067 [Neurospora crassa]|nr:hypothetical protein B0T13DRAFT_480067 [Neurospora crassa]
MGATYLSEQVEVGPMLTYLPSLQLYIPSRIRIGITIGIGTRIGIRIRIRIGIRINYPFLFHLHAGNLLSCFGLLYSHFCFISSNFGVVLGIQVLISAYLPSWKPVGYLYCRDT